MNVLKFRGVLASDFGGVTAILVKKPANGTVMLRPDGSFTYKPGTAYKGLDSFTYKVRDTSGAESGIATVQLVPSVVFQVSGSKGAESVTTVKIKVTLSSASTTGVTVGYAVTGGNATAGIDFTLAAGRLSFAPGQTSKDITLKVRNDKLPESTKTIRIALSSPKNTVLGARSVYTYTIYDDDKRLTARHVQDALATDPDLSKKGPISSLRRT